MLNWAKELEEIFKEKLPEPSPFRKVSECGIALYGAGEMGEMAIDLMAEIGTKPLYIIDKNKTGTLKGIEIISPDAISNDDKKKLSFVVCIAAASIQPVYDFLNNIGCEDVRHFYDYSEVKMKDIMPNGWAEFNITEKEKNNIKSIFRALEHDKTSIAHYLQFLWWRLKRKEVLYTNYPVLSGKKFFGVDFLPKLTDNEVFIDGGAHLGGSIEKFIKKANGEFKHIYAFEPDEENYKILKEKFNYDKITFSNEALYSQKTKIKFRKGLGYASKIDLLGNKTISTINLDSLENINPSIIKIHIEGDELKALHGAKKTIEKSKPIIMVMADHNKSGLCEIPVFLTSFDSYKLYFNLHDYCGNTAVFYAIPKKRS